LKLIKVREGKTDLLVPDPASYTFHGRYEPTKAPVFYNPKMEFSRDIAVLVLSVFSRTRKREIDVCDPLAGLGARGIRFAKEVSGLNKSVIGDLNDDAIPVIHENARINKVEKLVEIEHKDANLLLAEHSEPGKRFDYIDIDPFGTPAPFLDSAIRALKNGGLLAVTATDTAPLCGVYGKACLRKYGATPLRAEFCHEVGLRIMIGAAVREALKYDFGLEVLLSYSVDHYFRAYLIGSLGATKADTSASAMGHIFYCPSCGWRSIVKLGVEWPCKCGMCGKMLKRAGPLWCGRLADKTFVESLLENDRSSLNTKKRVERLLRLIIMECDKSPTFYVIDKICSRLKRDVPPVAKVIEGLIDMGYESSLTHFHPKAVKTAAPLNILMEIVSKARSAPQS
jgi:tRNA (guanine26-N2/guanine27-N2)-dimethyltransferase